MSQSRSFYEKGGAGSVLHAPCSMLKQARSGTTLDLKRGTVVALFIAKIQAPNLAASHRLLQGHCSTVIGPTVYLYFCTPTRVQYIVVP